MKVGCAQCGKKVRLCDSCHCCEAHCSCARHTDIFDADELGLDPETDNTPETESRHA